MHVCLRHTDRRDRTEREREIYIKNLVLNSEVKSLKPTMQVSRLDDPGRTEAKSSLNAVLQVEFIIPQEASAILLKAFS